MDFTNKTIWITGASSGIGKAVAVELSSKNCQLILSGRNKEALEEVSIKSILTSISEKKTHLDENVIVIRTINKNSKLKYSSETTTLVDDFMNTSITRFDKGKLKELLSGMIETREDELDKIKTSRSKSVTSF